MNGHSWFENNGHPKCDETIYMLYIFWFELIKLIENDFCRQTGGNWIFYSFIQWFNVFVFFFSSCAGFFFNAFLRKSKLNKNDNFLNLTWKCQRLNKFRWQLKFENASIRKSDKITDFWNINSIKLMLTLYVCICAIFMTIK